MTIIIDNIPAHPRGMHAGGAIAFGPDGKMYVTVGNAYLPDQAQNATSLLGKVLRINKDGTIPADNPVPGSPVYTMGHRNMYGLAFDVKNNIGVVTENGEDLYDEINVIQKGGNYGHPSIQMPNQPPELSAVNGTIPPIRSYWKTIAPTQAVFYDGAKFRILDGRFLIGSYNNGRLYALKLDGDKQLQDELRLEFRSADTSPIIAVAKSPSGDIYYGGYYIYKLDSVNIESNRTMLFPVRINSSTLHVADVAFDPVQKSMTVELIKSNSTMAGQSLDDTVTIEVPKALLDGISSVTLNGNLTKYDKLDMGDSNTIEVTQPVDIDSTFSITVNGTMTSIGRR